MNTSALKLVSFGGKPAPGPPLTWCMNKCCSIFITTSSQWNCRSIPLLILFRRKKLVCLRKTARVNFFYLLPGQRNCTDFYFFPLSIRINVFVIRSCLVNLIIVYLSSIHPPVTEGTYCEKIHKTLVVALTSVAGGR